MNIKERVSKKIKEHYCDNFSFRGAPTVKKTMLFSAVLDVLDLEDRIADLESKLKLFETRFPNEGSETFPEMADRGLSIALHADDDGKLTLPLSELSLLTAITVEAQKEGIDLDVRAVLTTLPCELGRHVLKVAVKIQDCIVTGNITVWFVPKA